MAPSDALPAQCDFPFGGYTHWLLPDRRPGAGEGLSSSRHHRPNVPRPLRRGVLRRCISRLSTPSVAFALVFRARLPLGPFRAGLTPRQTSRHAADRSVATSVRLPTLGFGVKRFPLTPPACYQAPWRLPGRDFHPLAVTSLRATRSIPPDTTSFHRACPLDTQYDAHPRKIRLTPATTSGTEHRSQRRSLRSRMRTRAVRIAFCDGHRARK